MIGPAIEHHVIRCDREEPFPVQTPGSIRRRLGRHIEFALDEAELPSPAQRSRRINDECAVHSVGDMHRYRRGATVIHERTGHPGDKPVVQRVARPDVDVILAGAISAA